MKDLGKIIKKMEREIPTTECIAVDLKGTETIVDILERTLSTLRQVENGSIEFPSQRDKRKALTVLNNYLKKFGTYEMDWLAENAPEIHSKIAEKLAHKVEKNAPAKAEATTEVSEELQNKEGRLIGYARVSTRDQNLDRQLKKLQEINCDIIFQEKKTGKNTNRPEYNKMLEMAKEGDTIVVAELTRISRSTSDLFKLVEDLDERGIKFKSLKEEWLDTTTATGRLLLTIFAGLSQFEREQMLERQAEGIEVAKERGVRFGKKLQADADLDQAIEMYKEGQYPASKIAKMCNVSRATLYRRLKDLGLTKY